MIERWFVQTKKADFEEISKKFNISPVIARLIRNRDVIGDENIKQYIHPDIDELSSPWLFKDMDRAVDILRIKISQGNKIRVICDYDVDGICSGYILLKTFKKLGADVDIIVPHRVEDGYGINEKLIQNAFDDGVDTIVTCDNGIAAYNQIEFAKSLGMTVIVTDHHEVPYEINNGETKYLVPNADAVIDQKQADCSYPFKELCGAMVAYKMVEAIYDSMDKNISEIKGLLIYAALATVCDVVELKGENRTVVKCGLEMLQKTKDIGINALIEECKIDKNNIDSYHLGFIIGPCLNASGRLNSAKKALDLLCTEKEETARRLAKELRQFNDERKEMTEQGTEEAIKIADGCEDKVLVIYLPDCHESIIGIIAGRLREKYNKPAIVLSDSQECVKGSGRSIEEYDMYSELTKVKDLFIKYGGHKMAAGISLNKENIDILRKRLNENCNLTEEDLYLKVWIDMQLPIEYVTMNLINELQIIQPWGKGNEKPVFAEKGLKILSIRILGKTGNAIKLIVENEAHYRMTAMVFGRTQDFMGFLMKKFRQEEINLAMCGKKNDIEIMVTYYPKVNEYNGNVQIQMIIDRFY